MSSEPQRDYRYLDTNDERRQLIADIKQARRAVLQIAESIPEARRYEPRYHGWTPAAMLAHLYFSDRSGMFLMQVALIGIRFPISTGMLNQFNDFTTRIFRQRVMETTMKSIQREEKRISDFILRLPINKFSTLFYHPTQGQLTVERGIQEFFLYHWLGHLQTMREVEGIFYEPPGRQDVL